MKAELNHWYGKAIYEAEKEIASLEERMKHLQEFISNGKLLSTNGLQPEAETPSVAQSPMRKGVRAKRGTLVPGGVPYYVRQVLSEAGKPLHTQEIMKRIKPMKKLSSTNPWADISGAMKRHPKIFKRIKPGVYALKG